jgi:Probable transposase.
MSSAGELLVDEERELTTPAIPEEGIHEVEFKNKRTNVVRLLPNGFQERKLRRLADTSAKLFNGLNYERRQQFFQEKEVDFRGTRNKYYEKYKRTLKVNADQVINKNNEEWSSFFSLLKLKKKEGCHHTRSVWGYRVTGRTKRGRGNRYSS